MQKTSFVAGLIAGGTLALGAVVAVPGIVPRHENAAQRVERPVPPIVIHSVKRDAPAKPPEIPPAAVREHKPTDEEELKHEAEALAVLMRAARLRTNETMAIATLRNIISAQSQFQSTAIADENRNGVGEYGSFGEMSAAKPVREVRVRTETGKVLRILCNDLDASAQEIAELYKRRWAIELFFRWVKQTLKIKHFLGTSENAVRIQIAVALIAYLLLRLAQKAQTAILSPLAFARLVRVNLMHRRRIDRLLEPKPTYQNCPGQRVLI